VPRPNSPFTFPHPTIDHHQLYLILIKARYIHMFIFISPLISPGSLNGMMILPIHPNDRHGAILHDHGPE
jgi:hypothetical protein